MKKERNKLISKLVSIGLFSSLVISTAYVSNMNNYEVNELLNSFRGIIGVEKAIRVAINTGPSGDDKSV
jgi:hypothetical protein